MPSKRGKPAKRKAASRGAAGARKSRQTKMKRTPKKKTYSEDMPGWGKRKSGKGSKYWYEPGKIPGHSSQPKG